jgi:hypothetical protein
MTMVMHVVGRDQRRHITAVQGALAREAQLGPAILVADRVPALMRLHPAHRGEGDPAVVGVGVGHHSLGPVHQHQPETPIGLHQPVRPQRSGGDLVDQRSEKLLVSGQLHQQPSHLVHIHGLAGTSLTSPPSPSVRA